MARAVAVLTDGGSKNKAASANDQLPSPFEPLENITAKFLAKGLNVKDVVVLSGAHTIGFAQCFTFKNRLFNFKGSGKPDPSLDSLALSGLRSACPNFDNSNSKLVPLDAQTQTRFDNFYYKNIPTTAAMVNAYSADPFLFNKEFAADLIFGRRLRAGAKQRGGADLGIAALCGYEI